MKNPLFDNDLSRSEDGGFSISLKPEGKAKMTKGKNKDILGSDAQDRFKEKQVNVTIGIATLGDNVLSRKTTSDSEPAETIVAIIRGLVGMVNTVAGLYSLNAEDLMDKVQDMMDEEFNLLQKKDE